MLQTQTVEKYIACFGSQPSGFSVFSPVAPGFLEPETSWALQEHTSHLHLFSWSLQPPEPAENSPPSVTTTSFSFSFVLVLWHSSTWHGCTRKIQVLVSAVSIIIMEWNKLACLMRSADGQRPSVFYSFKSLQASTLVSYQQYPQQHWSESWAAEPNNINRYIISFFFETLEKPSFKILLKCSNIYTLWRVRSNKIKFLQK